MEIKHRHDLFVSYNSLDVEVVEPLVDLLREGGIQVFIDRDMSPGSLWPKKLRTALAQSRSVAFFLGPHGLGRGQVEEIISLIGTSDDRPIIPVLLPGANPADLPDSLKNRIWVDFRLGPDNSKAFDILVKGISGVSPTRPSSASTTPIPSSASLPLNRPLFDRLSSRARNAVLRADRFRRSQKNARLHMEHLVVGLVDEGEEPVRQVFASAGINRLSLIVILRKVGVNLPSVNQIYRQSDATSLPRLSSHTEQALNAGGRFAEVAGALEIDTTHLLQGVFSVKDCKVVAALTAAGLQPDLVVAGEQPDSTLAEVSIRIASAGDQPVDVDSLGFGPYVEAVAEFLVNEETRPPLTLSIEGEWGSGKSSFMLQLEKALRGRCEPVRNWASFLPKRLARSWGTGRGRLERFRQELRVPCCLTVRFNAWRHDKEDALWAAFASEFLRRIPRERSLPRRWLGHFRLFLGRYRWRDGWLEMLRAIIVWGVLLFLGLAIPLAAIHSWPVWSRGIEKQLQSLGQESAKSSKGQSIIGGIAGNPQGTKKEDKEDPLLPVLTWLVGFGGLGAYTAGVISLALKVKGVIGNPLNVNLRKYLNSPDYDGHVAFVESFHEDFRRIVKAYAGDRKVYVFIDDLDRCEVPKAADLMQALNLLIADDPRLIFIIGMDREKVAAGLAVKYEKLFPYLMPERVDENGKIDPRAGLEYGYSFIEKFIQLPFRVPSPKPANLRDFLAALSGHSAVAAVPAMAVVGDRSVDVPGRVAPLSGEEPVLSGIPQVPPADQDTANSNSAQKQARREQFRLVLRDDSETLRDTALMVAPALENNPRRLKQFVNLFRLRTYIACETGAFDEMDGKSLTLPQMGKFVAISLVWPGLLTDLAESPDLLSLLYQAAFNQTDLNWKPSPVEKRWIQHSSLLDLLHYGCKGLKSDPKTYSLAEVDLDRLLRVSPKVVRTLRPAPSFFTGDREERTVIAQRRMRRKDSPLRKG